jgi:VIT1/CCC1 family predicted Fe2+/Mn2+ transporter
MTDLATETIDDLKRQRARIDAEIERRNKEETRTVYEVKGVYGRETHKHFDGVRKLLLEEISELSEHDFSASQREIWIKITPAEWSLSEYAARPDVVYG